MKRTGNYEKEQEDQRIYSIYQKLRIKSGEAMLKHKHGEISLDKFKNHLERFYEQYRTKWSKSDVDEPDFMEEKDFIDELTAQECRRLHIKLCELAEALGDLGHTNQKYEMEEKGVNKKQRDAGKK